MTASGRFHVRALMLTLALCISTSLSSRVNAMDNHLVRLATTTSTENSGLLNYLLPTFTRQTGYEVHVIAVGTGKALRMGKDGDVDVVLVHALEAEQQFVKDGYGTQRYPVMYNDFIIAGPANDPAGLRQADDANDAFQRIYRNKSLFISRGDNSGTHKKEKKLWSASHLKPAGSWYREAGQGMGKVLQIAGEMNAYVLTDRGTWLSYQDKTPLKLVFEGDGQLHNPYGIIAVSPQRYPDINNRGAQALIQWITSRTAQEMIGTYKVANTRLFNPSANISRVAGQLHTR